jgi:hypothetical protein
MGREIRRVPPHWAHPRFTKDDAPRTAWIGAYRPCKDKTYAEASREWKEGFWTWELGTHADQLREPRLRLVEYWEYYGLPPDEARYRPEYEAEPTWWQVYETVTEGAPVTPPFATPEELIEHLVTKGTETEDGKPWDPPMSREGAVRFVLREQWTPSMTLDAQGVRSGLEAPEGRVMRGEIVMSMEQTRLFANGGPRWEAEREALLAQATDLAHATQNEVDVKTHEGVVVFVLHWEDYA